MTKTTHMRMDASLQALEAAKNLVKDIEFFRANGTGAMCTKYPDYEAADGYGWIVRRARKMVRKFPGFANGGPAYPEPEVELLALAVQFKATVEYYIRCDVQDGDAEGANLKRNTLTRIEDAIAKAAES